MNRHSSLQLLVAGLVGLLLTRVALAAERNSRGQLPASLQLVRTALQFELEGEPKYRDLVLQSALREDPDCALARWHVGQLQVGDCWLPAEEIERNAAQDPKRQQYRQLRNEALGNWKREFSLARWCARQEMLQEQQYFLARVLDDPLASRSAHKEAMRKLNVRPYAGAFLTEDQIDQHETLLRQTQQAMLTWGPKALKWRTALGSDSRQRRAAALEEFRQLRDPQAIGALEAMWSSQDEDLALEVVSLLTEMPDHAATLSLVRHAVGLPWSSVFEEAIVELKKRPLHDFAPLLLHLLVAPVESAYRVTTTSAGVVRHEHFFFREGTTSNILIANSLIDAPIASPLTTLFLRSGRMRIDRLWETRFRAAEASLRAYRIEQNVAAVNAAIRSANQRTYQALERTAGLALVRKPSAWWNWWLEYNEVHAGEKPVYLFQSERVRYYSLPHDIPQPSIQTSCFAAGTKVRTDAGLVCIEDIRCGDRVLSQDPDSGELAYKLVLQTTVRPPSPILKISLGGTDIAVTKGHPLWVTGAGWRMAKHVQTGDRLHCLGGAKRIQRWETKEPATAYNLVVDEFGTYFVGEAAVLVHDNTYRKPTTALIPGLLATR